jgi:uracil phosphoribosyltransferase
MPAIHREFANLRVFDHPLIQQKLTLLRDRGTPALAFRRLLNEVAGLMVYEVSRDLATREVDVQTPLERSTGRVLAGPVTLVPILRAGIGMTDGVLALMPEAGVGHLGIYRQEDTLSPVNYYTRFPADAPRGRVYVIDPMLATGGTASFAVTKLKSVGCRDIRLICLIAAPEGVSRMLKDHADVTIYAAALDRELDGRGFIHPGLGDAGDRLFGTE